MLDNLRPFVINVAGPFVLNNLTIYGSMHRLSQNAKIKFVAGYIFTALALSFVSPTITLAMATLFFLPGMRFTLQAALEILGIRRPLALPPVLGAVAAPQQVDQQIKNAFFQALGHFQNNIKAMSALVDRDPRVVNEKNGFGKTPLTVVVYFNDPNIEVLKLLLENQAVFHPQIDTEGFNTRAISKEDITEILKNHDRPGNALTALQKAAEQVGRWDLVDLIFSTIDEKLEEARKMHSDNPNHPDIVVLQNIRTGLQLPPENALEIFRAIMDKTPLPPVLVNLTMQHLFSDGRIDVSSEKSPQQQQQRPAQEVQTPNGGAASIT